MKPVVIGLIVVSCVFVITLTLFITYIVLDRQYFTAIHKTLEEAPLVMDTLPILGDIYNSERSTKEHEPKLAGLIVEARDHPNLIPVIDNFQYRLPDVPIYVFHGITNLEKLTRKYGKNPKNIHFIRINSDNLTIRQYNYLMTRPELWRSIHAENVLVFQTDSVLFSESKVNIEDYYKYDYVGAPWGKMYRYYIRNAFLFRALDKHTWTGNGGLSLRKRTTMAEVTHRFPYLSIPYVAEDVYFSNALDSMDDIKLPERVNAAKLFFESIQSDEIPFGAHRFIPDKFKSQIKPEEMAILEKYVGKE